MPVADYRLTDPAVMADPYPFYAALHEENARAVEVPGVGYWVGRMNDVRSCARNTTVFSNSYFGDAGPLPTGVNADPLQPDVQALFDSGPPVVNALWTTDPPVHSQHRKLVNVAFTRRWVEERSAGIRAIADELLDALAGAAQFDAIADYAVQIPLLVIADALGVPRADREQFKHWSDDILAGNLDVLDHERRLQVARSWVDATRYFVDIIESRRRNPQDDLISRLATAEVDGERLENAEILPIVSTLLLAGNETTTNLIGNSIVRLLEEPALERRLRDRPADIEPFLEEVLRHDAPVQCLYRVTRARFRLGDVEIPEGAQVMLGWGCAGRDPEFFDDPARFDMDRYNLKEHVGFGYGPHLCVGLGLARAEARIAFEALFARLPGVKRADEQPLAYLPTFATRGVRALRLQGVSATGQPPL